MNDASRIALAGLASAFLGACAPDTSLERGTDFAAPIATRSSLLWGEAQGNALVFVEPEEDAVAVRRREAGTSETRIAWLQPTIDGSAVLALLVPADDRQEDVLPQLEIHPHDGAEEPEVVDVPAPFTSVSLGPDGRLAVLHFGRGPGTGVLQNANQVAILELADRTVRPFSLDGFGGQLRSVHFPGQGDAGPVEIGGQPRDLLAFFAEGEVVLVDARDPQREQVAVRFFPDVSFSPEEALLRPGNGVFERPVLFLRAADQPDVAMLTLDAKPEPDPDAATFTTQVSLVPVGGASDFLTHDAGDVPYLVTLDPSRAAVVFTDIRTQQGFVIRLREAADRMFVRTLETDAGPVRQMVAWRTGGSSLSTLRLDEVTQALGQNAQRIGIPTPIGELVQLDADRVLIGSGDVIYVVDLERQQVTPLSSRFDFDPRSSAIEGDHAILGTPGGTSISAVDLVTLDPQSMVLDEPIASFHVLEASGKAVAVHEDRVGHLTAADALAPSRATAYSSWGFLYADALDREDDR